MPNVYQNRYDGRVIAFFRKENKYHRSLRLMKKKLRNIDNHWNKFMHLTYDDAHVENASSADFRVFMNRYKQSIRNKIKRLSKQRFLGPVLAAIFQKGLDTFKYAWKVEFDSSGEREYNPHFHVLLNSWFIPKKEIDQHWTFGKITWIQQIYNNAMAQKYVSKYFSKDSENEKYTGRLYGTSRNVKKNTQKSAWQWLGFKTILTSWLMVKFQVTSVDTIDFWVKYEPKHHGNVKRELKRAIIGIKKISELRKFLAENFHENLRITALESLTNSELPLSAAVLDCLIDCSCKTLPLTQSPELIQEEQNNYHNLPIPAEMLASLNLEKK